MFKTPVLLITFKRYDSVVSILERCKKIGVENIFVVSDGPRNQEEESEVFHVRSIFDNINISNIHTLFRDENLGCKASVISGIDWFFDSVEQGIILEDDCIPDETFFYFCEEMLERYNDNERIMHISGSNFLAPLGETRDVSYFFSRINHPWGWATWRRAWSKFDDRQALSWKKKREDDFVEKIWSDKTLVVMYWRYLFDYLYTHPENRYIWDILWTYNCWIHDGISISPSVNLIDNIGFVDNAKTGNGGTKEQEHYLKYTGGLMRMNFPLRYPDNFEINHHYDEYFMEKFAKVGLISTCRNLFARFIHSLL